MLDGRSTLNMAANSAPDARIFTLDLPDQPAADDRWLLIRDSIADYEQFPLMRFLPADVRTYTHPNDLNISYSGSFYFKRPNIVLLMT